MNATPHESDRPSDQPNAWLSYLGLTVAFTLYGLSYDVTSTVAHTLLILGFFALLFVPYVIHRVRYGRWTAPAWQGQRFDVALVLVMVAVIAVLLTIGFAGPRLLTTLGAPLPHTLCWLAVGLLLFAGIPLNRWSANRSAPR
jgi:hypothetical protein